MATAALSLPEAAAAPEAPEDVALLWATLLSWSWLPNAVVASAGISGNAVFGVPEVSSCPETRVAPSRWLPDAAWSSFEWDRLQSVLAQLSQKESCRFHVMQSLMRLCALRASELLSGPPLVAFQRRLAAAVFQMLRIDSDMVAQLYLLEKLVAAVPRAALVAASGSSGVSGIVDFLRRSLLADSGDEFLDIAEMIFSIWHLLRPRNDDSVDAQRFWSASGASLFKAFSEIVARKQYALFCVFSSSDDVGGGEDERVSDVLMAAARAALPEAPETIPALGRLFGEMASGRLSEQAAALVRIAGHVLVAAGEDGSDAPEVPEAISGASGAASGGAVMGLVAAVQQWSVALSDVSFWFFSRLCCAYLSFPVLHLEPLFGPGIPAVRFLDGFLLPFLDAGIHRKSASKFPAILFRRICFSAKIGPLLIRSRQWGGIVNLVFARLSCQPCAKRMRFILQTSLLCVSRYYKTDGERISNLKSVVDRMIQIQSPAPSICKSLIGAVSPKMIQSFCECFAALFPLVVRSSSPLDAAKSLRRFLGSELAAFDVRISVDLIGRISDLFSPALATNAALVAQLMKCIVYFGEIPEWPSGGAGKSNVARLAWHWLSVTAPEMTVPEAVISGTRLSPELAVANLAVLLRNVGGEISECAPILARGLNFSNNSNQFEIQICEFVSALLCHAVSNANWSEIRLSYLASALALFPARLFAGICSRAGIAASGTASGTSGAVVALLHRARLTQLRK